MKATNRDKLCKRAAHALRDMYHNATLPFSNRELPNAVQKHFGIRDPHEYESQWISDTAEFEIDYINDGGAYGPDCEPTLRRPRWERITELYGTVYQWGRGGRTLAPEKLISQRGGSSFGIDYGIIDNMSATDLTELCLAVESFNAHVKAVCNAFPEMWAEHLDDLIAEYNAAFAAEAQSERPDMYAQPCSA